MLPVSEGELSCMESVFSLTVTHNAILEINFIHLNETYVHIRGCILTLSCTICSSRSRRSVRKLLDRPS